MQKKIIIFIIFLIPFFYACRTNSASQRQHQVEKQREDNEKEAHNLYEEGKEKHLQHQTKSTRKRMQEMKNKSETTRYNKKPCFLKRWFTRKPKTCVPSSS
jgi:F0F1-type ATP synthase membrane subunit b/b'